MPAIVWPSRTTEGAARNLACSCRFERDTSRYRRVRKLAGDELIDAPPEGTLNQARHHVSRYCRQQAAHDLPGNPGFFGALDHCLLGTSGASGPTMSDREVAEEMAEEAAAAIQAFVPRKGKIIPGRASNMPARGGDDH
jgi:hypothetical protein